MTEAIGYFLVVAFTATVTFCATLTWLDKGCRSVAVSLSARLAQQELEEET